MQTDLLREFDVSVPRYTSYPTAVQFRPVASDAYVARLKGVQEDDQAVAFYVHIPFCRTMCLYCACSVILNRRPERVAEYVKYLLKEIEYVAHRTGRLRVAQLHFGGGTPTELSEEQLAEIMEAFARHFQIASDAEIAIEIDPRTVVEDSGSKMRALRPLGFNRISFGVQDTDARVQESVKRRQSYEMTRETYMRARLLGFDSINVDLIYGLPFQTIASFEDTMEKISALKPDRIALFSYAKVPWLKPHQRAIRPETLPSTEEKLGIYLAARHRLLASGYVAVGMDHFAVKENALARAKQEKRLHRNFQGYTVLDVETMLGVGVTAIGYVGEGYFQNVATTNDYYAALDQGALPVHRGWLLGEDDRMRRWVIERLMCDFCIDKGAFQRLFDTDFDAYFAEERRKLHEGIAGRFLREDAVWLEVSEEGETFIRNVAAHFDYYLSQSTTRAFSKAI